jgi:hypothetical protein
MLLVYILFEASKEYVNSSVISAVSPASMVRRRLIIASKILSHSIRTVLKISSLVFQHLGLAELIKRCKPAAAKM